MHWGMEEIITRTHSTDNIVIKAKYIKTPARAGVFVCINNVVK
ncbi:MAG: hypothetical protein UT41_C0001G0078 [Candidatus Wolfebacteria bacterium GW2011_GWC2_39_22]|uniref:Uncharacterized protein n=1 Tax=Candidatus Wolfebacteria bacterium GW2011_GWC2_39_22 TaxID=1619013 RepID=A0A0G0N8M1_9BACT|nr:MAG: hypothetical protein UT41_C0001G0078 [Candidatus Wolfebacteria bacterium GW2011_GWC2_39_22]